MFNPYNLTFQPYFIFQAPTGTVPSFIFQQNSPFLFSQYIHPNAFQNGISLQNKGTEQAQPHPETSSSSNNIENKGLEPISPQIVAKKNIIKEKIIKKPANRPATYLTERKYYLAQTLQEETNLNRKLRPRNLKIRSQKSSQKSLPQPEDSLKIKENHDLSKDDNGSSQIFQACQKKKIEEGSLEVLEKSMKSSDSSSCRDDSK